MPRLHHLIPTGRDRRRCRRLLASLCVLITLSACNLLAPANGAITPGSGSPTATAACEVVVAVGLRLRSGPGTHFDTLTVLPPATQLMPEGRAPDARWLHVRVGDTAQAGWVSAAPEYLTCTVAIADLPVGEVPPEPTPLAAPSTSAQTSSSAEPQTDSPLKRDDPPPEGVADQLGYSGGAHMLIPCDPASAPRVSAVNEIEILGRSFFCATGFVPDRPIALSITRPDGTTLLRERDTTWENGTRIWEARFSADEPLGTYVVTAFQADRRASATFKLTEASLPQIEIRPTGGARGTTFRIDLAGFPRASQVPLYLYRSGETSAGVSAWIFQATIASVTTDKRGSSTYSLSTAPDDPPGEYRIVTEPPVLSTAFDIESRFEVHR